MLEDVYQSTRCHIAGDCYPRGHRTENVTAATLYELQNDGDRVATAEIGDCGSVGEAWYVLYITNQPTN